MSPPPPSRGVPRQEAKQAENTCTLADLPEGQVGKLLIRKSGKVQLVLGKVTLDVTMGTPCSFLQVRGLRGGCSGDLIWGATPQESPLVVPRTVREEQGHAGDGAGSLSLQRLWGRTQLLSSGCG